MVVVHVVEVDVTLGQVAVLVVEVEEEVEVEVEVEVVQQFRVAQVLVVGEAPVQLQVAKRLQRSRIEGRILHLLGQFHDSRGIF